MSSVSKHLAFASFISCISLPLSPSLCVVVRCSRFPPQLIELYGEDARLFLLQCLVEETGFKEQRAHNRDGGNKDAQKVWAWCGVAQNLVRARDGFGARTRLSRQFCVGIGGKASSLLLLLLLLCCVRHSPCPSGEPVGACFFDGVMYCSKAGLKPGARRRLGSPFGSLAR